MICSYYVDVNVVLQFAVCVCLGDFFSKLNVSSCLRKNWLLRGQLLCEAHQNKFSPQLKLPWLKTRKETVQSILGGDPTLL